MGPARCFVGLWVCNSLQVTLPSSLLPNHPMPKPSFPTPFGCSVSFSYLLGLGSYLRVFQLQLGGCLVFEASTPPINLTLPLRTMDGQQCSRKRESGEKVMISVWDNVRLKHLEGIWLR